MIKKLFFATFHLLFFLPLNAQNAKPYFQQKVHYDIEATLDDKKHVLNGYIDIAYTNNSPDALSEIYLHLWPNAYRTRKSAYAKQELRNGDNKFYFAENKQLGGYKDLNFLVNEEAVAWKAYKDNRDIAVLELKKPLLPNETINISTAFAMKIPDSFSRLGHVGQSYQMTQWYIKPAVYDQTGWHPMPYLDMGEFYSEWGSFDVKLTLPENYVVGATGELQTPSEVAFLQAKVDETKQKSQQGALAPQMSFPTSSEKMKTIQYKAENVHDFAWFADKRFYVAKDKATLASGKQVDTWVMFHQQTDLWKDAVKYVTRSVEFYSKHVGEYVWPHATAVESALSAGGGMEYPMITVIGSSRNAKSLDDVITHEVGHNWFYGMLASNERDFAWMDEGINSYYERRYMDEYYPENNSLMSMIDLPLKIKISETEQNMMPQLYQMGRNRHQPVELTSDKYTSINYGLIVYDRTAILFKYLEQYLGTAKFDAAMKQYFNEWNLKHPQPQDIRQVFERETGKNLSWFFDDFIKTTRSFDYAAQNIQQGDALSIKVANKGEILAPFPINAYKNGALVQTQWFEGFDGEQTLTFPNGDYDMLRINGEDVIPELAQKNNNIKPSGSKADPLKIGFLGGIDSPKASKLYVAPLLAFNNYDKMMAGLVLHNGQLPLRKLEWTLAPMFGFASKDIAGVADMRYYFYPNLNKHKEMSLHHIELGVQARKFSYSYNSFYEQFNQSFFNYYKIAPYINIQLKKKDETSPVTHELQVKTTYINQQSSGTIDMDTTIIGQETTIDTLYDGHRGITSFIPEISYEIRGKDALQPFSVKISLEAQQYKRQQFTNQESYLKATLETNYRFTYKNKKSIDVRLFGGYFIDNSRRNAGQVSTTDTRGTFALASNGNNDYKFEDYYFGRQDDTGLWSNQVSIKDGGFKTAWGGLNGGLGESNDFIVAVNFKVDLPMDLPSFLPKIRPYFDAGYFSNKQPVGAGDPTEDQILFNGGIALEYGNGIFGLYLPFFGSDNVMNILKQRGSFMNRISFSLDLKKVNVSKMIRNINF